MCNFVSGLGRSEDKRPREMIVQDQLLHYLESAYPNILPTDDLAELVIIILNLILIIIFKMRIEFVELLF